MNAMPDRDQVREIMESDTRYDLRAVEPPSQRRGHRGAYKACFALLIACAAVSAWWAGRACEQLVLARSELRQAREALEASRADNARLTQETQRLKAQLADNRADLAKAAEVISGQQLHAPRVAGEQPERGPVAKVVPALAVALEPKVHKYEERMPLGEGVVGFYIEAEKMRLKGFRSRQNHGSSGSGEIFRTGRGKRQAQKEELSISADFAEPLPPGTYRVFVRCGYPFRGKLLMAGADAEKSVVPGRSYKIPYWDFFEVVTREPAKGFELKITESKGPLSFDVFYVTNNEMFVPLKYPPVMH